MELSGYNKILVDSFLNRPNVKRDDNTISFKDEKMNAIELKDHIW